MKKFLAAILAALCILCAFAAERSITVYGRVKESLGKFDLTKAKVLTYDSAGNVKDTIPCQGYRWRGNGVVDTTSTFYIHVPAVDTTLCFDVVCDGYKTQTITYTLDKIGKRETWRELPVILMERAPRMLKELTVTTSKIKFYNKGDTLVYNADAFQLAEGSMLDALISQLPGVELSTEGQIKVNGKFVESLLLNGKEFMDGNNNLMLENIAAYTVKDVSVYEGQTTQAKRTHDETAPKILTMDVKLKKEYNMGWIINGQGGYGTDNRYLARLFALWFNATTRVGVAFNTNNLNDNRTPGRTDTWTPESMPSGREEFIHGVIDYNYNDVDETTEARGNVKIYQSKSRNERTSLQTSFLPGKDIYDRSFSNGYHRNTNVSTFHSFYKQNKKRTFSSTSEAYGEFKYWKDATTDISGTFDADPGDVSMQIIDALHTATGSHLENILVNSSKTRSDGWRRELKGDLRQYGYLQLNGGDNLSYHLYGGYISMKQEVWNDYNIVYGPNGPAANHIRHYTDMTPNNHMWVLGTLTYSMRFANKLFLYLSGQYNHEQWHKDQYMYALERLNDMGIYGVVPTGYLQTLDPANSFTSREIDNMYQFNPRLYYHTTFNEDTRGFSLTFAPNMKLLHRHLFYSRNNKYYTLGKTDFAFDIFSTWQFYVSFYTGVDKETRRQRNQFTLGMSLEHKRPEMTDLLDIVNDSDPLNVYIGNPDLKAERYYVHEFKWQYNCLSKPINNYLRLVYSHTHDALVQGYSFDSTTGVRYFRRYNLAGNDYYELNDDFRLQFGPKKQFSLSSATAASLWHYTDMVGYDSAPELTKLRYTTLGENLSLTYDIAGQSIKAFCGYSYRHTESEQESSQTLNAHHINYGVSGVFKLPAGFGASTDFVCYTRRGYGIATLDKTEPVWNVRLTYCPPRNTKWVFMVDGFDLLHKLSNVSYAVSATGRTVTYTNTLPRYVMFSVQYRLNIQPKKR